MAKVVEARLHGSYEDGISTGFERTRRVVEQGMRSIHSAAVASGGAWAGIAASIERVGPGARRIGTGAAAAIAALAAATVLAAGQMESAETSFKRFLGGEQGAKKFVAELQDFAANTPFEFQGLQQYSVMMLNLKFAASDVIPTLRAVGDAVAGLPEAEQRVGRVIVALGQIRQKQKVQAEEMMQLTEAGINAWEILAKKMGVTVPEAMKMAERGMLDANKTVAVIVEGLQRESGGRMAELSETFTGALSNFKDGLFRTSATIGQVFLPDVKRLLAEGSRLLVWIEGAAKGFAALPDNVRNGAYAITALIIAAGPLLTVVSSMQRVAGAAVALAGAEGLGAVVAAARNIQFAIQTGMLGALTSGEVALLSAARAAGIWAVAAAGVGAVTWGLTQLPRPEGLNEGKVFDLPPQSVKLYPEIDREQARDTVLSFVQRLNKEARVQPAADPRRAPVADPEVAKKELDRIRRVEEQMEAMRSRMSRGLSPSAAIVEQWRATLREIDGLNLRGVRDGEAQRQQLRRAAGIEASNALLKIERERMDQTLEMEQEFVDLFRQNHDEALEADRQRLEVMNRANEAYLESEMRAFDQRRQAREQEFTDLFRLAGTLTRVAEMSGRGRLGSALGLEAMREIPRVLGEIEQHITRLQNTRLLNDADVEALYKLLELRDRLTRETLPDWQRPLADMYQRVKALGGMDLSPITQMASAVKTNLLSITAGVGEAWGQFWSDLAAGQEGAGKRLLASLVGMIGKIIMQQGILMMQVGMMEILFGSSPFSAFAVGANAAHGALLLAVGAGLAAGGGILQGAARRIEGSSTPAAAAVQPSASSRPAASQIQPIVAGAVGGAGSPGGVPDRVRPAEHIVRVEMAPGLIAREVKANVQRSGSLRFAIQEATA